MDNLKDDLNELVSRVRNFTLSILDGEPPSCMMLRVLIWPVGERSLGRLW